MKLPFNKELIIGGPKVMNEETDYPKIWEELNRKVSSQQIKAMEAERHLCLLREKGTDQFYYMASFDGTRRHRYSLGLPCWKYRLQSMPLCR